MKKLFCLLTIFSLAILPVVGCGEKPKEKDAAKKEADGKKEEKKEADGAKKEADGAKKEADAK